MYLLILNDVKFCMFCGLNIKKYLIVILCLFLWGIIRILFLNCFDEDGILVLDCVLLFIIL